MISCYGKKRGTKIYELNFESLPTQNQPKAMYYYIRSCILKNTDLIYTKICVVLFPFMFFYSGYVLIL